MLNTPAVDGSFFGPNDGSGARHRPSGEATLFFDAIPSALLILLPDAKFTISAANDEYLKQTGLAGKQVIGHSFFDLFLGTCETPGFGSLEDLRASLFAVIKTGLPQQLDTRPFKVSCGASCLETRYRRVKNAPVKASDGSLLCIVHQIEDLTEFFPSHQQLEARRDCARTREDDLLEREQALARDRVELERERRSIEQLVEHSESWRLAEEKFRLIINTLPQHVWTARADCTVDFNTQQFADFAGVRPAAAFDDLWVDFIHPEDLERTQQAWSHSVATGEPYEIKYRLRHHTGTYRWSLARAVPLRDDAQKIFKWVASNTDIHDQVLAEQALRETHRRKDEFLAMLAHELRNPLAPIGAGAEILLREGGDESRVARVSEMISRQVRHVTGLIDELLEVSRVTTGRVSLDEQLVELKRVVRVSTEQASPLINTGQHRLEISLPEEPVCVWGDANRLVQVLSNLLNNAAKYTPDGGRIELKVGCDGPDALVRVKDNGVGMESELLERAFDLFQQGKRSAARTEGGLSLGLALVRTLVEQHHGTVVARSQGPGKGTEVTIRLPLLVGEPGKRQDIETSAEPRAPQACRQRILLVDDNTDVTEALSMLLEILGHEVATLPPLT